MPDMLVKLYELPDPAPRLASLRAAGVTIRRARAYELGPVTEYVRQRFAPNWADEAAVAFARQPVSCFIALDNGGAGGEGGGDGGGELIGFGVYESTMRNYFGPTAVSESARGRGVGKALLLACLRAMWDEGYAYAIIGGAGPTDFYAAACGATAIEGVRGRRSIVFPLGSVTTCHVDKGTRGGRGKGVCEANTSECNL